MRVKIVSMSGDPVDLGGDLGQVCSGSVVELSDNTWTAFEALLGTGRFGVEDGPPGGDVHFQLHFEDMYD